MQKEWLKSNLDTGDLIKTNATTAQVNSLKGSDRRFSKLFAEVKK